MLPQRRGPTRWAAALVAFSACVPAGADRSTIDEVPPPGTRPPIQIDEPRLAAFYQVWESLNPISGGRQRCAGCHSGSGPGRPAHSQDDLMSAYAAALTVITPGDPMGSRIYQQAMAHEPVVGVAQFDTVELDKMAAWINLEVGHDPPTPLPEIGPLLAKRTPLPALALSSMTMRVAQVPADLSELLAVANAADPTAAYNAYVDLYLSPSATPIDGRGYNRFGVVENLFYNPDVVPGAAQFSLTSVDFDRNANRGYFFVYPAALSRLVLQWVGFQGVRSSQNNPTVGNQDNFGALDAMMQNILADRPIKEAFRTQYAGGETKACHRVPFSGYQMPTMTRQVCTQNGEVEDAQSGTPVPGGIIGSRAFQRVQYGHYKFHTVRALFRSFHCTDFPVFNNDLVVNNDDSASRARVVSPWNETGTRPYCASCHANSNMNVMALAFWRFDDDTGVLRNNYVALRPTNDRVRGPGDILDPSVDATKFYYKNQVLDSFEQWTNAFVDDPQFIRCTAGQVYNFAMGRGNASNPEHVVPSAKVDELLAAYEAAYGPKENMTILKMLAVAFKHPDFTGRFARDAEVIAQDPCPESPNQQRGCESLPSARRISWVGYLAKWMQLYRLFGKQSPPAGGYASLPSEQFGTAYGHPDEVLAPLYDGNGASQYVGFHEALGEPMDDLGAEATTIAAFRGQHSMHLTAGAVKQACRISANLASRLFTGQIAPDPLVDQIFERQGNTFTGFKANVGLLAWGRPLEPEELALLNTAVTDGARFPTALTALMCSTMALVE